MGDGAGPSTETRGVRGAPSRRPRRREGTTASRRVAVPRPVRGRGSCTAAGGCGGARRGRPRRTSGSRRAPGCAAVDGSDGGSGAAPGRGGRRARRGPRPEAATGPSARWPGNRCRTAPPSASRIATRVTFGKWCPFRKHLGADDDVDVAGVHAAEHRFERAAPARRVPIHPGDAQSFDPRFEGARDPLGAEPEVAHVPRAALGAFGGRRPLRPTVVATQPPVCVVEHEMRVAAPAVRDPAAGMAQQPGRVAAPVDEQERLLRAGLHLLDRFDEHVAQAVVEGPRAQVDDVDARRRGAAGAARQYEVVVSAAPDVVDRLQRRGRAAEDDRRSGVPGAHHREVARGVAEPVLLLEGEIVFLVDDEEPRPRQRREDRGAGADEHIRGAVARMRPRREPLAVGEPGVQHLHAAGQPRLEAGEQLRCEADFGNEHERLASARDDLLDHPQVHLRLSAARHPLRARRAGTSRGSPAARPPCTADRRSARDVRLLRWLCRPCRSRRPWHPHRLRRPWQPCRLRAVDRHVVRPDLSQPVRATAGAIRGARPRTPPPKHCRRQA